MRRTAVVAIGAVVVVGIVGGVTALALDGRDPAASDGGYTVTEPQPDPTPADDYPITEPYAYPEVDFDAEDTAGNVELLRIPQETLDAMSTEALAWSVVDYPYFGDFLASSQRDGGVDFLRAKCDALDALLRRDDAEGAVQEVRSTFVDGEVTDEFAELKVMLLDEVLVELGRP